MISMDTIFVVHYYFAMKNVTITLDEEVAHAELPNPPVR